MQMKLEFIGDFSDDFTHIGEYDEDELKTLGQQSDTNVSIELDALSCLRFFPYVTNLILRPGRIHEEHLHYLYEAPVKRLKLDYYSDDLDEYTIDLSQFSRLEFVFTRTQFNFRNADRCASLTSLTVQEWQTRDLEYLGSAAISELKILSGQLVLLKGLEHLSALKHLELSNQRSLTSISDIGNCFGLEFLEIDSCNQLMLSEMPAMRRLVSLVLIGRQSVEDCAFFRRFPALESLVLDIRITDGNISPLLNLKHCSLLTDHRHYTHKNAELPKRKA